MKVALCHHYSLSHGGGGEHILVDAANYLVSKGHDVQVRCLPFRKRGAKYNLDSRVEYIEKLFHRFKADVSYHVYAPLMQNFFVSNSPKIAGLHGAVVADYEGNPFDFFKQGPFVAGAYLFRELCGGTALRRFDAIHTVNRNGVPIAHPRVFKIPNWVDCSKSVELLRLRRDRQGKFRILFVGKPSYIKGSDRFLRISRMFREDDIEFVATFPLGTRGFSVQDKVRFIGYVPNDRIWELYSSGGMLLHPTRRETFGLVILESLVSGLPVVTTPIDSHSSLKLPVSYASSASEFAREVKNIYDVWKNDYDLYLKAAEQGAEAVKHYDRKFLLPQFEDMLVTVANTRS